jgi:YHS domain-containing protein
MRTIIIIFLQAFIWTGLHAQTAPDATHYNLQKGLAIEGYDPVAYFKQQKAVKGSKEFAVKTSGVTYYFSGQANKDAFLKNPEAYQPQYGGWCAYAMGATGEKVEVDPETFKVFNGKLYLFYHSWSNNTLTKWNKDEQNLQSKADINWKKIIKK